MEQGRAVLKDVDVLLGAENALFHRLDRLFPGDDTLDTFDERDALFFYPEALHRLRVFRFYV